MSNKFIHTIKNTKNEMTTFVVLYGYKSGVKGAQNAALADIDRSYKLIDYQIDLINKNYKNCEVLLIVGFESRNVIEYVLSRNYNNVRIIENKDYAEDGFIDYWKIGINASLESDIYIIHGDRVFNNEAIKPVDSDHICTSISKKIKGNYDLGICYKSNKFVNMSYGLESVWSEITFLPKGLNKTIKKIINDTKSKKIYTIEKFLNIVSQKHEIRVDDRKELSVKPLKEIV